MYDVVIVGAGAAGVAAGTRLLRGGVSNFVILEAENRIGGRVNSAQFDGCTVDMGAQWVHGEQNNVVYEMASHRLSVDEQMNNYASAEAFLENGEKFNMDIVFLLYSWIGEIEATMPIKLKNFSGSLGDFYNQELAKRIKEYPEPIAENDVRAFMEWFEKFENSIDGSDSWFETSGKGHLAYVDCPGELLNKWNSGGYLSAIKMLIEQTKQEETFEKKIVLSCEVESIDFSKMPVKVKCKGGAVYEATSVIVTVSLGVLKEQAQSLFTPSLPQYKMNAIKGLAIGCVNKIYLSFPHKWWHDKAPGFCFFWSNADDDLPLHKKWHRGVFGFFPVSSAPNVLCGWMIGEMARYAETLPDEEVQNGCMELLQRYLGKQYAVVDCTGIKRSTWYSNPHFRGSYSFRSMDTELLDTAAIHLATPLSDANGNAIVQFAGEASHPGYFSTVHGAIESGWREADRILARPRPMLDFGPTQLFDVIIVGAGMAGLGAARTLYKAGLKNFAIIEAQNYAGGRACTVRWGDGSTFVEKGAQWIHGEHGNPLLKIAREHNLLNNIVSFEGLGPYLLENGDKLDLAIVREAAEEVQKILVNCERFSEDEGQDYPPSVGHYLRQKFYEYIDRTSTSEEDRIIKEQLLDWHLRFQIIDNSCRILDELSAKSWGDYDSFPGTDCNNLKNGYSSLVDAIVSELPKESLYLSHPVNTIVYQTNLTRENINTTVAGQSKMNKNWIPPVIVTCENGARFGAQFVIVTCSLGVLKSCHKNLFLPALPDNLSQTIQNLGYENITKIYLEYEEKWWREDEKGFQLLWSRDSMVLPGEAAWCKDMTGFDIMPSNYGNVILGWVGSESAKLVETLPEDQIGMDCTKVLRKFLNRNVPVPKRVFRTQWFCNPYVKGAYSFSADRCDESGTKPSDLLKPVTASFAELNLEIPIVLLAGEAAHDCHFSTTHGAFETGEMQGNKILSHINISQPQTQMISKY
ncbi:spermine oxidase-like [Neocloeon triangulifer]|uniref:spermine oxidase-like n=1 Tax=Neocloeon triangulifer TaxID=2078957 RepID=UPI00286F61C9|nr:spermine oxidase-like [Neocloeon triangulifer]